MSESVVRRITWRNADIARVLLLGLIFLFVWTFFWRVYSALFIALLAVLIAIVLHVPARYLSRWIPFRIAFVLTTLAFLAIIVGFMYQLIPQILDQIRDLTALAPGAIESITRWMSEQTGGRGDQTIAVEVNQQVSGFVRRFMPLAYNMITVLAGSFAIFTLAVFLALQPDVYRDLAIRMVPPGGREQARRIYDEAGSNLKAWVIGKAFTMALVGIFVWIGLKLFGVEGALVLAALAALCEFIPTFGPTIAAVPAIVAAFPQSPATALYVAIYYFVLQQIQNALTVPLVERRAVDIPPAVLLVWQLMLAIGFGILGLFVATPLLAVIVVAVRILYVEPTEERSMWDRRDTEGGGVEPAIEVPPG